MFMFVFTFILIVVLCNMLFEYVYWHLFIHHVFIRILVFILRLLAILILLRELIFICIHAERPMRRPQTSCPCWILARLQNFGSLLPRTSAGSQVRNLFLLLTSILFSTQVRAQNGRHIAFTTSAADSAYIFMHTCNTTTPKSTSQAYHEVLA